MFVDDIVGDIQSQPGTFTKGFGGEKRTKKPWLDLRRDPRAGVDNLHNDPGAILRSTQSEYTATIHGIDGVVNEIAPHLVQLAAVGLEDGEGRIILPPYFNPLLKFVAQDDQRIFQALMDVDRLDWRLVEVYIRFEGCDCFGDAACPLADFLRKAGDLCARSD